MAAKECTDPAQGSRAVLRVIDCRNLQDQSTLAVLEALHDLARRGQLQGLLITYQVDGRPEEIAATGSYRARPELGIAAAARTHSELVDLSRGVQHG